MQRRHYIVCTLGGDYQLKEIDAAVAEGLRRFGILEGHCHTSGATDWTFYFMRGIVSSTEADAIAAELVQRITGDHTPREHTPHKIITR